MKPLTFFILLIFFACNTNKTITKKETTLKVIDSESSVEEKTIKPDANGMKDMEQNEEGLDEPYVKGEATKTTRPEVKFEDRAIIFKPPMEIQPTQAGKVTIKVCINKDGFVESTAIDKKNTTITDQKMLDYFLERGKQYRFRFSRFAPATQCGFLDFKIVEED